jgi:hypothetical protein
VVPPSRPSILHCPYLYYPGASSGKIYQSFQSQKSCHKRSRISCRNPYGSNHQQGGEIRSTFPHDWATTKKKTGDHPSSIFFKVKINKKKDKMSINERNDQLQVIVSFRLVQNKWAVLPSASSSSPLGVSIESNSIEKALLLTVYFADT